MSRTLRYTLASVSALALSAGAAHAEFSLHILHTNDVHSRIESINAYDSTCAEEDEAAGECFGGVARIKAMADELRSALEADGANVLLLDAGDQFQGSLFYTTYKGKAAAEFMNMTDYDVMAIGNHEFDDGPETLAAFIDRLEAPVISGNTIAAEGSELHGDYEPYVVREFGEERVAILSVLATDTDELSSPGDDISFEDEIAYLRDAVAEVEGEGIDKIILLSHVGYVRDRQIAEAVGGIDAIVGGHSHTLLGGMEGAQGPYPTMVEGPSGIAVPIVTTPGYSKYLGELHLEFDEEGVVTEASGTPHLLDASVTPDEKVAARVEELKAPIEKLMNEQVAEAMESIDGSREACRQGECEMGNLVTDAMLAHTADQGVQIAIQNGGGLRASIDAGEITMGEVIAVLPFQNTLATFELTGAGIVEALENGVSEYEEQAGRFAQVAGLRYTFDPNADIGNRIVSVEVSDGTGGFEPIDEEATYLVATNNYMRTGGDGYAVFEEEGENAYDYGPGLEQVLADYLAGNSPYEPYLDGRIEEVGELVAAGEVAQDEAADDVMTGEGAAKEDEPAKPLEGGKAEMGAGESTPADPDAAAVNSEDAAATADMPESGPAAEMTKSDTAAASAPMSEPSAQSEETGTTEEDPAAEQSMRDDTTPAKEPAEASDEPMTAESAIKATAERERIIIRGDTLWDIAEEIYDDGAMWRTIADANPGIEADRLEIGATLVIPARP